MVMLMGSEIIIVIIIIMEIKGARRANGGYGCAVLWV